MQLLVIEMCLFVTITITTITTVNLICIKYKVEFVQNNNDIY